MANRIVKSFSLYESDCMRLKSLMSIYGYRKESDMIRHLIYNEIIKYEGEVKLYGKETQK